MKRTLFLTITLTLLALGSAAQEQASRADYWKSRKVVAPAERERIFREATLYGRYPVPIHDPQDYYTTPWSRTDRSLPEEKQPIPWYERLDCVKLTPQQIDTVQGQKIEYSLSVIDMKNKGDETFVTFAFRVGWDKQWLVLNRYEVLFDPDRGDCYYPRRVLKDIPFDKVLIIEGYKGKAIQFTIAYPRLDCRVKSIVVTPIKAVQTEKPLNGKGLSIIAVPDVRALLCRDRQGEDIF